MTISRSAALALIKSVHTAAWFAIESCMVYVLVCGLAKRTDRTVAVAGGVVAGETLIFAANGFRCPLTTVAERFGAEHGGVTDIYLPRWFARALPVIHLPLIVAAVALHAHHLVRERQSSADAGAALH
ncbi:MAG TPA: hypothetical protein VFB34_14230 [Chloroflexota bacterium]|nr:hypothetical protein [Chloroflexota bacterium]